MHSASGRARVARPRAAGTLSVCAAALCVIAITAASAPLATPTSHAISGDGPPPGYTGGFGEENCRSCHWENHLNVDGGIVRITGVPLNPAPGSIHELEVVLSAAEMKVAGFQLSVRFDSGAPKGAQAGILTAVDTTTRVTRNDTTGIFYLAHTRAGTALHAAGTARWRFRWTAPDSARRYPIIFHVAANAGDDNNSEGGDFIHVAAARTSAARTSQAASAGNER